MSIEGIICLCWFSIVMIGMLYRLGKVMYKQFILKDNTFTFTLEDDDE